MPSSCIDSLYFCDLFSSQQMRDLFSDRSRFSAWLRVEAALSTALARAGVLPHKVAERIETAARVENLDFDSMKLEYDRVGFPISPLVHQLAKACDTESARWIHWGATTQDIIDTALVLQMREGLVLIEKDLQAVINALVKVIQEHRKTVMAGRTFQQQAAPITFGYKVAVWLDEILRHKRRLPGIKDRALMGQLGGAVGTLATLGDTGIKVRREFNRELELKEPVISWHTARDGWAELVHWLAMVGATLGKIATEVAVLMRTEVNEVREPYQAGRGASSTMPQKRNPISAPPVIAIAHRLRECVGSQLLAMIQEHERSVATQPLEWLVIPEAFMLLSGALKHSWEMLEKLDVDDEQMLQTLNAGGGFLMAESVMMGLAPYTGRNMAHELVSVAAGRAQDRGQTLREALLADKTIMAHLTEMEVNRLMEPANYLGCAEMMIDAVLAQLEEGRR